MRATPWEVTHIRDLFFIRSRYDYINEHRGIFVARESPWTG